MKCAQVSMYGTTYTPSSIYKIDVHIADSPVCSIYILDRAVCNKYSTDDSDDYTLYKTKA